MITEEIRKIISKKHYYKYFQTLFIKGIPLQVYHENTNRWYPLAIDLESWCRLNGSAVFRSANSPKDMPFPMTDEYYRYWREKSRKELVEYYNCGGELVIANFRLLKHFPFYVLQLSSKTTTECSSAEEISSNNISIKEQNMKETTVEVKINGEVISSSNVKQEKVKTDIKERGKQLLGTTYDDNGKFYSNHVFKNEKQATKLMQQPEYLGKTLIVYKPINKITTNIPLKTEAM